MLSLLKRLFGPPQPASIIPDSADELIRLIDQHGLRRSENDLELQLLFTPDMDAPEAPVMFTQRQRAMMYVGASMCCGVPSAWAYCTYAMGTLQHS